MTSIATDNRRTRKAMKQHNYTAATWHLMMHAYRYAAYTLRVMAEAKTLGLVRF